MAFTLNQKRTDRELATQIRDHFEHCTVPVMNDCVTCAELGADVDTRRGEQSRFTWYMRKHA